MARPKLSSPDQPLPLRWLFRAYEALASLKLAVFVISLSAILLAWATFVDSAYDFKAARFGIYGTWWFAAVVLLLGLNVLCAMLIRFPWKRYQTGFVITHIGILVLLVGCLFTRISGIDAQMPILEGASAHRAFEDTQRFDLTVYESSEGKVQSKTIQVPFVSGPFSWREYDQMFFFPWRFAHIDRDTLYDHDGIRLEVLDYLCDADMLASPPLKLQVKSAADKDAKSSAAWQDVELSVNPQLRGSFPVDENSRHRLPGGEKIVYWIARSEAEKDAFLDSQPQGPLGEKGQLVLHAAGQKFVKPVAELKPGARWPLGNTGIEIELGRALDEMQALELKVYVPGDEPIRLVVMADNPDLSQYDVDRGEYLDRGLFVSYWTENRAPADKAKDAKTAQSHAASTARIDILQGVDGRLYYRAWKAPKVHAVGPLHLDDRHVTVFSGEANSIVLSVAKFEPCDLPGIKLQPVEYAKLKAKEKMGQGRQRRARVRLTVDGRGEEFWLDGIEPSPLERTRRMRNEERSVMGDKRRVAVSLAWDSFDLGFNVYLHRFNCRLDPGTSMASEYSSLVDIQALEPKSEERLDSKDSVLARDVLITLNEPKSMVDPQTGRTYRMFQESFSGPFRPGSDLFDLTVGTDSTRDQLFISTLTANYDPGRGLKYTGSLLIVAGVMTMFYMKAYFFKRRGSS